MFLSKIGEVYYLFFNDENSIRCKVTTRCKKKSDALDSLRQFKLDECEKRKKIKAISFADFAKHYMDYSAGNHTPKTQKTNITAFKEFQRVEGNKTLRSIGVREIEHFLSIKRREASDWSARKYFAALASAFETAKRWNCIVNNPFRNVRKPQARELQPVYFLREDIHKLLALIHDKDFEELCICGLLTGLRLAELINLQWSHVDFFQKVILVQNTVTFTTKSKRNRIVPMTDDVWKMLASRKERAGTALVFHLGGRKLKEGSVSQKFKKYVRKAGLNDRLHFHSLRHTFASWLVQKGVSLYAVQKLLGHSTSKMTEIYSHLMPQQLHSEVNRGLRSFKKISYQK